MRREKFAEVEESLKKIGVTGLTYLLAEGRGKAKGEVMVSGRGTRTYRAEYVERIKLEVIVRNSDVQKVVDAIMEGAATGSVAGDGKVVVSSVEQVVDISSGRNGEEAL